MYEFFVRNAKIILKRRLNIDIKRSPNVRPLDLSAERGITPISAIYAAQGRDILLYIPLEKCITSGLLAYQPIKEGNSPFVQTLVDYATGKVTTYQGSQLQQHYGQCRPSHAADLLGIEDIDDCRLREAPPIENLYPWGSGDLEQLTKRVKRFTASENNRAGSRASADGGSKIFGPTTRIKGEIEFGRLVDVYKSICKNGFVHSPEGVHNVEVTCLWSEAQGWKFNIKQGLHRVDALAALGYDGAIMQLCSNGPHGLIRREDARYWPTVRAGLLTVLQAQQIFDRIYNTQQPQWSRHRTEQRRNVADNYSCRI